MKYAKKINTTKGDIGVLLPILIALCLIPFVILTKDYQTEFSDFVWFNVTEISQIDSFEYAKSISVVVMGVVAAVVIIISAIGDYMNGRNKKKLLEDFDGKILVLCAVYFIMVIISSVCSSYPNLAFMGGGYGQWQTMQVLLAYVWLFLYAYKFVNSENRVSLVIKCMMVTVGLLALIGVM